jgi:hypothetical protein
MNAWLTNAIKREMPLNPKVNLEKYEQLRQIWDLNLEA